MKEETYHDKLKRRGLLKEYVKKMGEHDKRIAEAKLELEKATQHRRSFIAERELKRAVTEAKTKQERGKKSNWATRLKANVKKLMKGKK